MDVLERKKSRERFQKWKRRAKRKLPSIAIKFYEWKLKTCPHDWDVEPIERTLGRLISALNNPFYSIRDGARVLNEEEEISDQILVEWDMKDICKFVNQKI